MTTATQTAAILARLQRGETLTPLDDGKAVAGYRLRVRVEENGQRLLA